MSKERMVEITGMKEISSLFDVSEDELDKIVSSGIIDYEGTYPYFKAMVLHLIGIGDKSTPKTVEISFTKLLTMFAIAPVIPIIGITSVIGIATGLLLGNKFYGLLPANALPPP